jgi:1-acyl-sn-glycerol-3-phosphate acyltransferase
VRAPLRFRLARFLLRLILSGLFRVRLEGADRLPGRAPYLLACNHLSWVDPFLLLAWLPASPRIHFLGRRSAIYNRTWKRWLLQFMGGVIPVESGDIEHLSQAVGGALARGSVVAIFPEGRTGSAEGQLQRLRHGVAHFAARSRAPVVPVGLAGTLELWRGKSLSIRVGEPLQLGGDVGQDMAAVEQSMREALPPYWDPGGGRPWAWLTTLLR